MGCHHLKTPRADFLGKAYLRPISAQKVYSSQAFADTTPFMDCLGKIGLTGPAMNLPPFFFPSHTCLRTVAGPSAPGARLKPLALPTPDGICSLTLCSSILKLASGYFYLKIGTEMVRLGGPLEASGALGSSARSSSNLGSYL